MYVRDESGYVPACDCSSCMLHAFMCVRASACMHASLRMGALVHVCIRVLAVMNTRKHMNTHVSLRSCTHMNSRTQMNHMFVSAFLGGDQSPFDPRPFSQNSMVDPGRFPRTAEGRLIAHGDQPKVGQRPVVSTWSA